MFWLNSDIFSVKAGGTYRNNYAQTRILHEKISDILGLNNGENSDCVLGYDIA